MTDPSDGLSAEALLGPGVVLDRTSTIALYAQLRDLIARRVRSGDLPMGSRLPASRTLAAHLNLNTMTVMRTYKDLAQLGLVVAKGPRGTFLRDTAEDHSAAPAGTSLAAPVAGPSRGRTPPGTPRVQAEDYVGQRFNTFARMMRASNRPSTIPLTQAYPDAFTIDAGAYEDALRSIISERPASLYSYVSSDGLPELRRAFAEHVCRPRGLAIDPEEIIVTTGGQQAIMVAAMTLLRPGDCVLVEEPTYFGALDLFRSLGMKVVGIPMLDDGPDVEEMERAALQHAPKLIFTIPTFHNPTGITMSLEKRHAILALARRHGIPILEDDCCSEMRFTGTATPSIRALAGPDDDVFYFASMGKVYVPGIRLGFLAVPPDRLSATVRHKTLIDLHTSPLIQLSFERFLTSGAAVASIERARSFYGATHKALLAKLDDYRDLDIRHTSSQGGLNIWVNFPQAINPTDLFYDSLQRNVSLLLGDPFCVSNAGQRAIRLSFGHANTDELLSGVDTFIDCMKMQREFVSPQFPVIV